jgi:hypothetical protein
MANSFFEDDLDDFFDTDEFAIDIVYNGKTLNAIFDDEFAAIEAGYSSIDSSDPQIMLKSSDVEDNNMADGDTISISGESFLIHSKQPDGTGVTTLILKKS